MTITECYDQIDEDYGAVAERFGSETIVGYFCSKFLQDRSFTELTDAIQQKDAKAAFRAAHTLKGICLNLGFKRLGNAASELTEFLRGRSDTDKSDALYAVVAKEYRRVTNAFSQL